MNPIQTYGDSVLGAAVSTWGGNPLVSLTAEPTSCNAKDAVGGERVFDQGAEVLHRRWPQT